MLMDLLDDNRKVMGGGGGALLRLHSFYRMNMYTELEFLNNLWGLGTK
jgi:hypothetical protein